MKSVNVAELKSRLSAYLNDVRAGEEILVRDRKTPIARILPVTRRADDDEEELHRLAAEGKVRLGEPLDDAFWDLPAPRVRAATLRRVLDEERDGD
ncbi:MAG: type II toxin-antitoxin system Phd/YefM family antitoxin [Acidobacteria bacterium]|nr:type II toxin-antitoxin system Phd/YefM family antitoxin [Acidobacteriota bacterium]